MTKVQIFILIILLFGLAIIISSISETNTYVSFNEASKNPGKEFYVIGKLNLKKGIIYNPENDANLTQFYMIDNQNNEMKVNLYQAKPYDFEKSEQIVTIGKYTNGEFASNKVLLKCPSKYMDKKEK